MTKQTLYNRAVKQVLRQGHQCVGELGPTYQNGKDYCAIGWLLPGYLKPGNRCIRNLMETEPAFQEHFKGIGVEFLVALQMAHDNAAENWREEFVRRVNNIAKRCNLRRV